MVLCKAFSSTEGGFIYFLENEVKVSQCNTWFKQ